MGQQAATVTRNSSTMLTALHIAPVARIGTLSTMEAGKQNMSTTAIVIFLFLLDQHWVISRRVVWMTSAFGRTSIWESVLVRSWSHVFLCHVLSVRAAAKCNVPKSLPKEHLLLRYPPCLHNHWYQHGADECHCSMVEFREGNLEKIESWLFVQQLRDDASKKR